LGVCGFFFLFVVCALLVASGCEKDMGLKISLMTSQQSKKPLDEAAFYFSNFELLT
jgi:hypothetical protein